MHAMQILAIYAMLTILDYNVPPQMILLYCRCPMSHVNITIRPQSPQWWDTKNGALQIIHQL